MVCCGINSYLQTVSAKLDNNKLADLYSEFVM